MFCEKNISLKVSRYYRMDNNSKKNLFWKNKNLCSYGAFEKVPIQISQTCDFNERFSESPPQNNNISFVETMPCHGLSIAKKAFESGYKPVVVNIVDTSFNGGNMDIGEGVFDDIFYLSTNFYKTLNANKLYPIKHDRVIYAKLVLVFRDENLDMLPKPFLTSIITCSAFNDVKRIDDKLPNNEYINTQKTIECIFQTAFAAGHDMLILNDFLTRSGNYPYKDIVEIYNACILKYVSLFKLIVVAFPVKSRIDSKLMEYFAESIIKPQTILQEKTDIKQENQEVEKSELNMVLDKIVSQ